MDTYIKTYGYAKTMTKNNKKKSSNETQWLGDYDGEKLNMNINTNK